MNVLITSVSRKVWLVQAFKGAVKGYAGKVYATDLDLLAAGLYFADQALQLPSLNSTNFLDECLAQCHQNEITLIIPTRDEDLAWFSRHIDSFNDAGIQVMVASEPVINLCQDKQEFLQFCQKNGFTIPHTHTIFSPTAKYPVFSRPRFGKGGLGSATIDKAEAEKILSEAEDKWIIQDLIRADEYTIDLFTNFTGTILSIVPRQRLRVQSGEVVVSKTIDSPELIEESYRLATTLGLVGHNTLQCFWDGETINWIEVNPRYGGGAALSIAAGADTPAMLLGLLHNKIISPIIGEYKKGLYLFRYSADIFMDETEAVLWK